MTSSSGKEIKEIVKAHVNCLMYELLSSSRYGDGLSIGFHRNFEAREKELTNNKRQKEIMMSEYKKIILVLQNIKIIASTAWVIKYYYKEIVIIVH